MLSLETAVQRMSGHPAAFLGIPERGVLREGWAADLVVIDLEALALACDLPGGAPRLYQGAQGYRAVLVNGVTTLQDDQLMGQLPGSPLRGHGLDA